MPISSRLITAVVVFGFWGGPGAHGIPAQARPSPSELIQNLQSEQTTDEARNELLKLGRSDPEVRQYLTAHLPPLIESGPSARICPGYPCQGWRNAVELAGNLKIGEASAALARWISVKDVNPWPGIHPYGNKVEINPSALALSRIGDPAIPALRHVLDSGSPGEHALAVRALCTINTPKAKAVLGEELPHESDPNLQAQIKRVLGEK
jgi:PBS lyase HEAT-like repeat-containing protein